MVETRLEGNPDLIAYIESLKYARIIQQGLLPKKRHFDRMFRNHFVLFEPLDYVSGDFYWVAEKNKLKYLAVGDCTGHGVPGAMLSVLAKSIIEYSILNKGIVKTNRILEEVDKKFIESFTAHEDEQYNNDWFEVGLICVNEKIKTIYFSSANRKLLHIGKQGANIYRGDRFPIGGWQNYPNRSFSTISFQYEAGDMIYLGSDGFQDQLGGLRNKKFSSNALHGLLEQVSGYLPEIQLEILKETFTDWKGTTVQTDDVCLVGVQL